MRFRLFGKKKEAESVTTVNVSNLPAVEAPGLRPILRMRDVETEQSRSVLFAKLNGIPLGAKLLDKKVKNWAKKIDLNRFCINSAEDCILGQLFKPTKVWIKQHGSNGYLFGVHQLFGRKTGIGHAAEHGFNCTYSYKEIVTAAWHHEIEQRIKKTTKKAGRTT